MSRRPGADNHTPQILAETEWRGRQAAHQARVDDWLTPLVARRRDSTRHPVEDFLFTYYSFRPARLRRWQPGPGVTLTGGDPAEFGPGYLALPGGASLDTATVLARRRPVLAAIQLVLAGTASRPAQFRCFGMHEWAMVYRQEPEQIRHRAWPLRLSADDVAAAVEAGPIRCTHIDAYRFFTPQARPLNVLPLTRAAQAELEQPGCLHANMDLYKYSYKLSPLVSSEFIADCFALAREIRAVDMRASPYDLSELGYQPVRVETPEGRAEYATLQRECARRAEPLRRTLLALIDTLAPLTVTTTG
jgi:hypothetical protein